MSMDAGDANTPSGLAGDLYTNGVLMSVLQPNVSAKTFCNWLAQVIIDHIQANAEVSPNGTMVAPSGGGPVTGTGVLL